LEFIRLQYIEILKTANQQDSSDQHAALKKAGGYYVFVVYRLQSDGIRVTHSRSIRASSLSIDWYGETVPRGREQAELPASELVDTY
jgi:hypothetical protein